MVNFTLIDLKYEEHMDEWREHLFGRFITMLSGSDCIEKIGFIMKLFFYLWFNQPDLYIIQQYPIILLIDYE